MLDVRNLFKQSLGTLEQIELIFTILHEEKRVAKNDLLNYSASKIFDIRVSFEGIVSLLYFTGYIKIYEAQDTQTISLEKTIDIKKINIHLEDIAYKLIKLMDKQSSLSSFFNIHTIRHYKERIYYTNLPCPYPYIRNFFKSIGIFEKDVTNVNEFIVSNGYIRWFKEKVIPMMETTGTNTRKFSLKQLKNINYQKEEAGRLAEEWVLDFEKKRLIRHPLISEIKIISEEYCNAGYDIKSYDTNESIILDRYIEVKSYTANEDSISFYWSKNEIKIASYEGDNYYIYIVNRDKMVDSNYIPEIIKNPYELIFNNESEWEKACESYKFTKLT